MDENVIKRFEAWLQSKQDGDSHYKFGIGTVMEDGSDDMAAIAEAFAAGYSIRDKEKKIIEQTAIAEILKKASEAEREWRLPKNNRASGMFDEELSYKFSYYREIADILKKVFGLK